MSWYGVGGLSFCPLASVLRHTNKCGCILFGAFAASIVLSRRLHADVAQHGRDGADVLARVGQLAREGAPDCVPRTASQSRKAHIAPLCR